MLKTFAFRRYRCFRDWQTVDLGRLHLVYGANGAGKSALVRLLPWIAASRRIGTHGPDTDWEGLQGAGVREVIWRGQQPEREERSGWWGRDAEGHDPELAVALRWSDEVERECVWRTRWMDDQAVCEVESLHLKMPQESSLERVRVKRGQSTWRMDEQDQGSLKFDGLVPRLRGEAEFIDSLHAALDRVEWLGPKRIGPTRAGAARGAKMSLGCDGSGAQSIAMGDVQVLSRVSDWYRDHVKMSVEVESLGRDLQRLVLSRRGPSVPFADSGEGLQQVFPSLVALEQLRQTGGLLAIEEPETHLHPALQAAWVEHAGTVLADNAAAQVLVETHSEVVLLGALQVGLKYGLEVRVSIVEVDEDGVGEVRAVPLDAQLRPMDTSLVRTFSTMGVLRKELIEARSRHAN